MLRYCSLVKVGALTYALVMAAGGVFTVGGGGGDDDGVDADDVGMFTGILGDDDDTLDVDDNVGDAPSSRRTPP